MCLGRLARCQHKYRLSRCEGLYQKSHRNLKKKLYTQRCIPFPHHFLYKFNLLTFFFVTFNPFHVISSSLFLHNKAKSFLIRCGESIMGIPGWKNYRGDIKKYREIERKKITFFSTSYPPHAHPLFKPMDFYVTLISPIYWKFNWFGKELLYGKNFY